MKEALLKEVHYLTSRSSGPGGQHVNKTESKVTLVWDLESSEAVSMEQKSLLKKRLKPRLSEKGELILSSQDHRLQQRNKDAVTERFLDMIEQLSIPPKPRHKTKPTRASREKRLKEKKIQAEKKQRRSSKDM